MAEGNIENYENSIQHIGLADWHAAQWQLHQNANEKQIDSFNLRYDAKSLTSDTTIKTEWNNRMNNHKISDRVTELSRWHGIFELLIERIQQEIHLLIEQISKTDKELELLDNSFQVTLRCIEKRNNRLHPEITYDDGDINLKKELNLIEEMKKLLIKHTQIGRDKLNCLEELKSKLTIEMHAKYEAIQIDTENYDLSRSFPNFTYKPYALNITENSSSYEKWLEHTQHMKQQAEFELSNTYTLRETIRIEQERLNTDIEFQQDATSYALRRRAFESKKARNELEWQKLKIKKEIDSLGKEIDYLKNALRAKDDDVKCVETRLENRTYRAEFELCKDESDFGLRDEMIKLQNTKTELTKKIDCAGSTFKDLERLLNEIRNDLENKKHSLTTDVMCLDIRSSLIVKDGSREKNETDRNIILTDLSKEISLETRKAFPS